MLHYAPDSIVCETALSSQPSVLAWQGDGGLLSSMIATASLIAMHEAAPGPQAVQPPQIAFRPEHLSGFCAG